MKAMYIKGFSLLIALVMSLALLVACGGGSTVDGESSAPAESEIQSQEATAPETTPPETEPASLTETEAKALLTAAIAASEAKTAYANTMHSVMTTEGVSMMDVSVHEITDGNGYASEVKALGMSIAYVILDGKAYTAMGVGDTYTEKYLVSLTDAQEEKLMSTIVSSGMQEGLDVSFMMSTDAFVGLSGERQADGSVLLTATDMTAEAKANMDGGDGSTVTITTCTMTVSADNLLTGLALAATITIPETDFSAAMTMGMSVTQTTVYDNITVTAPEDADSYLEESYAAVFEGTEPLSSVMNAAGMPMDGDNFVIDATADAAVTLAQGQLFADFPHLYADKLYTVTAPVVLDDVSAYLMIGDSLIFLDCYENVLGPMEGDVIKITAPLMKIFGGEDNDLSNYGFYLEEYEIVERTKGSNGGTYMFVDVNSSLNVRSMPSTAGNTPIGSYVRGDVVEVLEIVDGWAKIVYERAEAGYAYVSIDYLSES